MASLVVKIMLSFMAFLFFGCGNNPVDIVKNGTLDIDKSVSIGNAFEGYKYFYDKRWKTFADPQQRTIVEFSSALRLDMQDVEKIFGVNSYLIQEMSKQTKSIVYTAQFKLNKDEPNKFNLAYSGIMISVNNGKSEEHKDNRGEYIRAIYNNEPLTVQLAYMLKRLLP